MPRAPPPARVPRRTRPRVVAAATSGPAAAGLRPGGPLLPRARPLLATQVAVPGHGGDALGREAAGELLGDRHAAVLAAGAAHGQRQVALALPPVARDEQAQDVGVAVDELRGVVLAEDVVADVGILPGLRPELRHPVRVG